MAVILSPRGNEASNMMKRFVRYEEAAQYFGLDETLIIAYAKAAGAVYQLCKIRLIKIEPLEDYMKHLTKVGRSSKLIQRKFVRVGEGTLIYNIGRNRFIEMAREDINTLKRIEKEIVVKGDRLDILSQPCFALSPSACFHVYAEYKNQVLGQNMLITFTQNVFRNEGRLNFKEVGRLRDYHVKEIVFLGDEDYVASKRNEAIDKVCLLLEEWELDGNISSSADPFVLPKMQKFKKIQKREKIKYEVQLYYNEKETMAVASFNLHGGAFTHAFNIKLNGNKEAVTGCIGFGLERWVLCFLARHGEDVTHWPEKVREEYIYESNRKYCN